RRDIHKMRAFVRFRSVEDEDGSERFVAWFEPEHHILRASAGFFVRRFTQMRWSILTPRGSMHWDGEVLSQGPPAQRSDAPAGDPAEELWRKYYASIFNPARLKVGAMLKEMPRKYWKNMPEAALIPGLVAGSQARELAMVEAGTMEFGERPKTLAAIVEPARVQVGGMLKEMPGKYWKNRPEAGVSPGLVAGSQAREIAMVEAGTMEFGERPKTLATIGEAIRACRRCPIGLLDNQAV